MDFIPPNHNCVSPYLVVPDAYQLLDFLKKVFDAEEIYRMEDDGMIRHAEVKIHDSVIMLATAPSDRQIHPTLLHIYVADAVATLQKALDNGATLTHAIKDDTDAGDQRGQVTGPQGNMYAISTHYGST